MTEPVETRDVMGLRIPLPLVARMIAAIRDTYPTVVDGKDDDEAVRAVVRHWFTSTLVDYEARRASRAAKQAVADATKRVDSMVAQAAEQARLAAEEQITEVP